MMFDRRIGGSIGATIASIENAVAIFVAILGVTDQAASQDSKRCSSGRPAATFDGAQTAAHQPANDAADRPGTLIEGGSAIAVSCATGQQAAKQQNR
jgi:hypothetical protein